MSTTRAPAVSAALPQRRRGWVLARTPWSGDSVWGALFVLTYLGVFLLFVVYPVGFGLWLSASPAAYADLFRDPIYIETVENTLLLLVIGVNLKLFLALLLSGFFLRTEWWVRLLLLVFILPWAVPAIPTFISFHWLLNGQWGLINSIIWTVFGVDGPG